MFSCRACRDIETFYQDGKEQVGLDEDLMRNAKAIGKHWCLVFVVYSLLHYSKTQLTS